MKPKIEFPDWEAVGKHYDKKGKEDLNYLSALDKRIIHHHSGIFNNADEALHKDYSEEALLTTLGKSEDRITHLGARVLGMENKRGFDCGCGRGGSSFIFARDYGHTMFGITISDSQLAFARESARALNLCDKTEFEKLNIYCNEIPGKYDFVWACESTEYMPDHFLLLKILYDLLVPGGKVIIAAISYRQSQVSQIREELEKINRLYETKIGGFSSYLEAALKSSYFIDDILDLGSEIIPYYRLRLKSQYRRGSEEWIIKGLENGAFKYSFFLFAKK